jgi:frizzled protein 1/7
MKGRGATVPCLVVAILLSHSLRLIETKASNSELDYSHHDLGAKGQGRCEAITIPMCKDMPYNETYLPNLMGHGTQEEAGYDVHQYYALVKVSSI